MEANLASRGKSVSVGVLAGSPSSDASESWSRRAAIPAVDQLSPSGRRRQYRHQKHSAHHCRECGSKSGRPINQEPPKRAEHVEQRDCGQHFGQAVCTQQPAEQRPRHDHTGDRHRAPVRQSKNRSGGFSRHHSKQRSHEEHCGHRRLQRIASERQRLPGQHVHARRTVEVIERRHLDGRRARLEQLAGVSRKRHERQVVARPQREKRGTCRRRQDVDDDV